jgi:hypothetical protein
VAECAVVMLPRSDGAAHKTVWQWRTWVERVFACLTCTLRKRQQHRSCLRSSGWHGPTSLSTGRLTVDERLELEHKAKLPETTGQIYVVAHMPFFRMFRPSVLNLKASMARE